MPRCVLFFNFDKNMVDAADEVRNAIASVRYKLPIEIREPILQRLDPAAQPIMQLALSSTTLVACRDLAAGRRPAGRPLPRHRRRRRRSTSTARCKRELSVLLRSQKLREYEVSVTEVVAALRAQNTTAPVGKVRGELEDQSIRLVGRIESPAEFGQIVVKRRGNEMVRLAQVAEVQDGFAEPVSVSMRSGQPNVGLSITRTREASTVSVADEVAQAGRRNRRRRCRPAPGSKSPATAARRRRTASTT